MQVPPYAVSLMLFKLHKTSSKVRILKILKEIFQLESIPCKLLHDILKGLLPKICFDASRMCLSRFVACHVTFNDSCCGLLSRTHLFMTDQSLQTGPNESVLHCEVVFEVC